MLKKYNLIGLITFCFVFLISCVDKKNEPNIERTTTEIQKDTISKVEKVVVKTPENPIYKAAERLNMVLFGKKLKHLDFTTNSKKTVLNL